MWSQTPQFDLLLDAKEDLGMSMNVQHGSIKSLGFESSQLPAHAQEELRECLVGMKLQDIYSWTSYLHDRLGHLDATIAPIAKRLDLLLPVPKLSTDLRS